MLTKQSQENEDREVQEAREHFLFDLFYGMQFGYYFKGVFAFPAIERSQN